ncbi:MAG TPA: hypothetical protein DCM08_03060, partial [Microscillaceae bacterium]|nr:hypothetical protein [Microscillaceae bacterium]
KSDYHPKRYEYVYQNTHLRYEFDTFKVLDKSEEDLTIAGNPFSVVMLTAKKALEKSNREDAAQLIWKTDLVRKLKEANYEADKIRRILNFIRYYVHFREDDSLTKLNQSIQTTFKQRKNMGIEEAILKEVEEKSEKRGEKRGLFITALNAIKEGFNNATIQKLTGLPVEEIEKLRKEGLKG